VKYSREHSILNSAEIKFYLHRKQNSVVTNCSAFTKPLCAFMTVV